MLQSEDPLASTEAPADSSSIVLRVIGDEDVGKTTLCLAFSTRSVRSKYE